MKKFTFGITASALSGVLIALLVACNAPTINTNNLSNQENLTNTAKINNVESKTTLKGQVQFPQNFKTKATFSDVAPSATVSLIYPSNHSTKANVTVGTGLTDVDGKFTLNPDASFTPSLNAVFVLEASKRLTGTGSPILSLRTYVRWNGSSWDSMTKPGIFINTFTTALSIISGYNPTSVPPNDTISSIVVSGNSSTPTTLPGVTDAVINSVAVMAKSALQNNNDPVYNIAFSNGSYFINIAGFAPVSGVMIDRAGLPAVATLFLGYNGFTKNLGYTQSSGDNNKDVYNTQLPSTDNANYAAAYSSAIQTLFGRTQADANFLANQVLAPDVLPINVDTATAFPNGRKLADDVIDGELHLLTNNNATTDQINANDSAFSTTFPYLAGPH